MCQLSDLLDKQRAAVAWLKANRPGARAKLAAARAKLAEVERLILPALEPERSPRAKRILRAINSRAKAMTGPNRPEPRGQAKTGLGEPCDASWASRSSIRRPDELLSVVGPVTSSGAPSGGAVDPSSTAESMVVYAMAMAKLHAQRAAAAAAPAQRRARGYRRETG